MLRVGSSKKGKVMGILKSEVWLCPVEDE